MAGAVDDTVAQAELLSTCATVYRASGWRVEYLHRQRSNPGQQSGPDLLVLDAGRARAIKALVRPDLTAKQEAVKARYMAAGIPWVTYHPDDMLLLAQHAADPDHEEVVALCP